MATCPSCHAEKPLAAPVCNECNNVTSVTEHFFFGGVYYATVIGLLFLLYVAFSG